jgi:hypothetical protein
MPMLARETLCIVLIANVLLPLIQLDEGNATHRITVAQ